MEVYIQILKILKLFFVGGVFFRKLCVETIKKKKTCRTLSCIAPFHLFFFETDLAAPIAHALSALYHVLIISISMIGN